jgi:hypothetical protein
MIHLQNILQADTTSTAYKAGYLIGSWLPFGIMALLAIIIIALIRRKSR